VVVNYLFNKFPEATPGQLSWSRSRVVCSAALAAAAVQGLSLHKSMLVNNVELSVSISEFVPVLEAASPDQIVNEGWKMDPPKAISDVFESVMGAVLVDSGYDYEKAASVVESIMTDLLDRLTPNVRHDPISELSEWVAKAGCQKLTFR
jgi:endoribonuclease Dicer